MTGEELGEGRMLTADRRALLRQRLRGRTGPSTERPQTLGDIPRRSAGEAAPLAPVQHNLWVADRLLSDNSTFSVHRVLRLIGTLDRAAVRRALDALVERHESLRLIFRDGHPPKQTALPPAPAALHEVDLTALPPAARANAAMRLAEDEIGAPFDLERGPVFRAVLVACDEDTHMLVLNLHHCVADEWSCGVLGREFGALYAACVEGAEDPLTVLPELPASYTDYAAWQADRLSGDLLATQRAYWRKALDGVPPVLELPTDRVRPPTPTFWGHGARRLLSAETSTALRAYARDQHVTLYTAVLAAYAAFLHRWTGGQERFSVLTPVSGRVSAATEPLIGMLANTLPVPMDTTGAPDFATLTDRVHSAVMGALEHQDVTFEQLVADAGLPRDGSRNPLAQVMFQCIEAREHVWELPGLVVERPPVRAASAKVDLSLIAVNLEEGVRLDLVGEASLFEPATVERMLDSLVEVLTRAVTAPDTAVDALDLLAAADRDLLAKAWNPAANAPPDGTVLDLFDAAVATTPDAPAVVFGEVTLTYRELDAASDLAARKLTVAGVAPGALVGVHLPRSERLVVALLGLWKAGCAYLPLPLDHPADRLEAMIEDAGAALVLAERGRSAPGSGLPVLHLEDGFAESGDPRALTAARADIPPVSLAYVLYTSGSTGRPKGVAVQHSGVLNFLSGLGDRLGSGPDDVWLGLTDLSFDISVAEMFLPLITGGRVVLTPEGTARDATAAAEIVRTNGVTHVQATPSGWRILLTAAARLPRLALAMTGGETLPPSLAADLRQTARRVLNCYGPTETTVWATYDDVTDLDAEITVGTPTAHVRAYVLDASMRIVPPGVPGELYIGGAGVGHGYHARPALTAGTYLPDPFGPPGARLYRTGDQTARRPDGRIRFLGRNDHQVKIRGHRIELGEIEARLSEHPDVSHAVVVVQQTPSGTSLVGYHVGAADEGDLRRHLVASLPAAMVPATFVPLESMPLSSNGKADRKRLPAPRATADDDVQEPPADGPQRVLAGLWRDLLGVEKVGPRDNFFALGGDSVSAVFLVSRAREAGFTLTARQVFAHQTLAELAAVAVVPDTVSHPPAPVPEDYPLAGLDRASLDRVLDGTGPNGVQDIYPCTPLQAGMLFEAVHDPGGDAYFIQYRWEIEGDLAPDTVTAAWQHVVDRHDALRCSFRWEGLPRPLQVVHRSVPVDLTVLDWRDTPAADLEARLERTLAEERHRGFDLFRSPPHRLHLIRTGPATHHLVWHSHHVLADGWSVGPVVNEVFATVTALRRDGHPPRNLPAAVSHRTYVEWLENQDPRAAERHWRETLAGLTEPTPVPVVRPADEDRPPGRARTVELSLQPELVEELSRLARARSSTLGTLLQGAWAVLLGRWSRRNDVLFGLTVSGRSVDLPQVERTVGLLSNTLPVRVCWSEDDRFGPWLARLGAELGALRDVEHCALVDIQGWSDVPGDRRLFDSILVVQNLAATERADLDGLRVRMGPVHQSSGYPLMLNIRLTAGGANAELIHDDARVDTADAERMLASFGQLLVSAAKTPDSRIADLAILPESDHDLVVRRWNDTARAYPAATTVPSMFADQLARTPCQPAVTSGSDTWSYAELDSRAEALAQQLSAAGVRPGDRVALRMDRSAALFAAVLAVWRVRGTYVPVDPEYPEERVAHVLTDAGVRVLLTDSDETVPSGITAVDVRAAVPAKHAGASRDARPPRPDDLAYVLYTSGSTGRPKGVEITHRSLALLVAAMTDVLAPASPQVWLGLTALSFDISTVEMFVPLTTGGRVVVVPEEARWDAAAQRALIRAHGVTHVQATPSGWRLLLAAGFGLGDGVCTGLVGGEALPGVLATDLTARLPRLVNVYGPTEATVWATYDEVDGDDVTIGRPLPNVTAHVLDASMRPVSPGVPGELYLGGAGVGRGYRARPALTARAFVPDPFGPPGARLYRTGDLAAYRDDGRIRFLGRTDHQVKIRGHRIELGEIEEVLARHPHVASAAVTVCRDANGEEFLAGYVVGASPDPAEVRAFLRTELPRSMVPARLTVLERMPLNPAGKVDRPALPAPDSALTDTPQVAPRTPIEQTLATIWAEILGAAEVGVHDDFFALGGNSMKAVLVAARAREAGLSVTTRRIFAHPTVEALAAASADLDSAPAPAREAEPFALCGLKPETLDMLLLSVGREEAEDVLPMSPLQTGLLLHTLAETGDYVRAFAVDIDGTLDPADFEEAWTSLVDRYAILRSTFRWADLPHPVQVVHRAAPPRFEQTDLTGLPPQERQRLLDELTKEHGRTVFDLAAAPPARFLLIRVADDHHRFVWTTHHIVFDGWSLHTLFTEAFETYRVLRDTGRLPDTPAPPPYREYLHWLTERNAADTRDTGDGHWHTALAGFTRPTPLPGARTTGHAGGLWSARRTLAPTLLADLEATARRRHVTVGTLVHTAWALLLARTSGEGDVVFGTTVSGRFGDVPGVERMVGLLMNTLPLRVAVDSGLRPGDLLADVHARLTEVAARAHVALTDVRRAADVPAGRELFESLVVFTDTGGATLPPGVRSVAEVEARPTGYPLVLEAAHGDTLTLEVGCARTHYDQATAERLLSQTEALLAGLCGTAHATVADVPMLSAAERWQNLHGWNDTGTPFPDDRTLHSLVQDQATATPDLVAVRTATETLTYAELNTRANRVAHRLRRAGIGAGALVALCTERSLAHVVGLLGILKAGAAYVPVDPEHPTSRQEYLLDDADAKAVLTQIHLAGSLPGDDATAVPVLAVDDPAVWADEPDHDPDPLARPADLCSLYYTSGSTGAPKGVASHHAGWVNRMAWMQRRHGLRPGDAVLHKTTLTFDDAAVEILWPLLYGGQVVLLPPGAHRDAHAIADAVAAHSVVHVQFVPSVLEVFLDVLTPASASRMTALRSVLTSGEALRPGLVRRFRELFGDRVSLDNTWGATEVSIDSTCRVCTAEDAAADNGAVALGLPIDNNTVHVLDQSLAPLPMGVTGELFIGGPALARGYHQRPALTAERFVPDPYGPPGSRLYRTGDLGRRRADGVLEFVGRNDHQVKLGGVRVELGEVEDALRRIPGIRDAVADVRFVDGMKLLVAYLTGDNADPDRIRTALRAKLPGVMIPRAFVVLDALPLNANGKTDRSALPDPQSDSTASDPDTHVAPRTATEQAIAEIWERVLRVRRIGVHDNFRDLGGDSILLIHTVARAREAGLTVTPRMVFDHPTVAALAAAADAEATRGQVPVHAEQGRITGEVPLGPIQVHYADLGPRDRFNQTLLLHVDPSVTADTLRAALRTLVEHHDALRLRWTRDEDGWHQYLTDDPAGDDPLLVTKDPAGTDTAVEVAHAGLDLARGRLLRAVLDESTRRLLLVVHHVAVDTVSWTILAEDLATLCAGGRLPAKTTSVRYWAERLAGHAESEEFRAEAAFWTLPRPAVASLPVDRAEGRDTEGRSHTERVVLPAALTDALLRQAAAAYSAEAEHLMLAALADTLTRSTGGDTCIVDVERHGREPLFDDVDLSRTVGWFTSVQPLVLTRPASGDPGDWVAVVAEHARTPGGRGIGHGLARHLRRSDPRPTGPGAQVSFNYHGRRDTAPADGALLWPLPHTLGTPVDPDQARSHLLEIDSAVLAGELHMEWRYAGDLFDAATVRGLAEDTVRRLTALVKRGTAPGAVRRPAEPFVARLFPGTPVPLPPMLRHRVPGVGIAMIADGELRGAWGFGTLGADDPIAVDDRTLFQVGSVSKHVTALAVVRLVQEGRLDLDADVNTLLTSWRLPGEGVTLRHLLTHTSGLGAQDYHGHRSGEPVPSLRDVLDGRPPAPTQAVRPDNPPGSPYLYSSSNYSVVQQILQDVTGQGFDLLMRSLVLDPLGMTDSDFALDAPRRHRGTVARNHDTTGHPYPEGPHLYPQAAAGGLWSTPRDVARVAVEIHQAVTGGPTAFLQAGAAAEMLRPHPGTPGGLGVIGKPYGDRRWFGHTGGVPGFRALTWSDPDRGNGLVVMANSDAGEDFLRELLHELGVGLEDARW
ncbi:amino acid adenylation domain-containing protein [Streptomyces sp. NBC_01637]|uniref:amino acid adenylation domain-containing protein n=1 Tax=unclassified Streptomyces TaxID=2593676 RepID=UPI00386C8D80|nr:amino acid adenylation domain-containing protein [Streptomyces sp. NBC_01653]WTC84567.1 amino acid adenylation domain-containing protein [Streptomyces sp. NBC_01653]WTD86300.1 amino acid adenylation domain-containing protein [Streptomyces sp. NBC_01637]WTD94224.1 amino acid adenylation domain-containing protein [Streptomyces sp. NBC_01637]